MSLLSQKAFIKVNMAERLRRETRNLMGSPAQSQELEESTGEYSQEASFFPPLWQQRRNLAFRIIGEHQATSVIDFGCGEAALLSFLIWETTGDYPITRLAGVDLLAERLEIAEDACQPQEFELGANLRVNELSIEIYRGSVADADYRLQGYDALACLEVVEHLDPEVLEKFWSVVLGTLRPKLVVVSTPNAEFNVHFPQLNYGTAGAIFRNDDHRFEWTRQEFEDWCRPAAKEYGYTVSFTGVGMLADKDPSVGFCSQFAILKLQESQSPSISLTASECHSLVAKIQYPVYSEVHTEEEILAYLHDKIAYIRPRPPQPFVEDNYYELVHDDGSKDNSVTRDAVIPGELKSNDEQQQTEEVVEEEKEAELGVVMLDDLWLALDVRQRCKRRSRMIKILETSKLVQVNLKEDKVVFDEEDEFWKEFDRQNDASELGSQTSTDLDYNQDDFENYQDESYYESNEGQAYDEYANYGELNDGWDKTDWLKEPEDSPWNTPAVESTTPLTDSWDST
ncbi:Small RNA 2'-O-methyltransferase [Mortierella sp. AM989]|nr:Small RNA 2'-O-methyltransferase [Mortierella sp. AM989]